ncbi:MAG: archaeosortase/exosortase family protein [Candidatus Kapabacteria bacterium]|nr:archaeosortase/exosortase family protein [Candidatus Kapabacteria bacterium]
MKRLFKNIDEKRFNMIQFVLIFGILTSLYYTFAALGYLNHIANSFAFSEIKICGPILKLFYKDLIFADNFMMVQDFRVNVNFGCDGTEPILIFIFAIIAFPSSLLNKLPALIIGSSILYFVNLLRIAALFYIGYRHHDYMDVFHNDIFPFAIVIIEFGLWLLWIKWMNKKNVKQDIPQ